MAAALNVDNIHSEFQAAFPELAAPYARCACDVFADNESRPFLVLGLGSLLRDYIAVLLSVPSSERRDQALQRAFAFVERLGSSSDDALISIVEDSLIEEQTHHRWWFQQCWPFAGPHFRSYMQRMQGLKLNGVLDSLASPEPFMPLNRHDLWEVQEAVASILARDGVPKSAIPAVFVE